MLVAQFSKQTPGASSINAKRDTYRGGWVEFPNVYTPCKGREHVRTKRGARLGSRESEGRPAVGNLRFVPYADEATVGAEDNGAAARFKCSQPGNANPAGVSRSGAEADGDALCPRMGGESLDDE